MELKRQFLRSRLFQRRSRKVGLSPGTVEYLGERPAEPVKVKIMTFDQSMLEEEEISWPEGVLPGRDSAHLSWLDITGVHDTAILQKLGDHFNLHPLVLEDMVNTHQRPKLDEFEDYLYIVLRMLYRDDEQNQVVAEQVSVVLGDRLVISVQETGRDVFEPVRDRLRKARGRIRKMGADYLAYALLDAVVDNYFVILEGYGEEIEELEDQLLGDPAPEILQRIQHLRREMIILRKSVWPLREVVSVLERGESALVTSETTIFLRDLYDHTIQVIDAVESFRDMISGMQDLYLSSISNRMNEVMKVLTIIATIFVPLTFVAGIYGMNFEFMPELRWRWSYPAFWVVVTAITCWMLGFFRRKRWL